MAYSDFDLATARDRLGLTLVEGIDLFADTPPAEPGELVTKILADWVPRALAINTEKARSEMIITPILMDVLRQSGGRVSLFSGIPFDVDWERGLNGPCDYLLSKSPRRFFVDRPVATVIDVTQEDMIGGIGQCAAAMLGAQLFNARHGKDAGLAVHGAVSSGNVWRFLRLEGLTLTIDRQEYYLHDVGKIIGILLAVSLGSPVGLATGT